MQVTYPTHPILIDLVSFNQMGWGVRMYIALLYVLNYKLHIKRTYPIKHFVGGGKSLARPGRKQATATKLGIYSTYSPWSSIHFLARYSNVCKPLKEKKKKKIQKDGRPTSLHGSNDLHVRRKMATVQLFFFSVQETGGSPTGPDPENRVGDQDTGSPGRPVSSGLQMPGEPGHCRARTRPPWWPSRGVFP